MEGGKKWARRERAQLPKTPPLLTVPYIKPCPVKQVMDFISSGSFENIMTEK